MLGRVENHSKNRSDEFLAAVIPFAGASDRAESSAAVMGSEEADSAAARLSRIEESVELLRAALPREQVAQDRLDEMAAVIKELQANVAAAGRRERQDWDLLSAAVRRADALKTMESDGLARVRTLEASLADIDKRMMAHDIRLQVWCAAMFLVVACALVFGLR